MTRKNWATIADALRVQARCTQAVCEFAVSGSLQAFIKPRVYYLTYNTKWWQLSGLGCAVWGIPRVSGAILRALLYAHCNFEDFLSFSKYALTPHQAVLQSSAISKAWVGGKSSRSRCLCWQWTCMGLENLPDFTQALTVAACIAVLLGVSRTRISDAAHPVPCHTRCYKGHTATTHSGCNIQKRFKHLLHCKVKWRLDWQ